MRAHVRVRAEGRLVGNGEARGENFFFFAMGRSRGVVATGGGRALGKKNLEVANVPLFFSFYPNIIPPTRRTETE